MYSNDLWSLAKKLIRPIEDAEDEIQKFTNTNKPRLQPDAFEDEVRPKREALRAQQVEAENALKELYKITVKKWADADRLNAKDIPAEIAIVSGGEFTFTVEELTDLYDSSDSSTAKRLILKYAVSHGVPVPRRFYGAQDKATAAENLTQYAVNSVYDRIISENILWSADAWAKVSAPLNAMEM